MASYHAQMTRRRLKLIETVGFVLVGVLAVGALVALRFGLPRWVLDAAIGVAFLIAFPTMWLNIRRKWRGG